MSSLKYNETKIYKITCKDSDDIYINATTVKRLCLKFNKHKDDCKKFNQGTTKKHDPLYDLLNKGICRIELIETLNLNSKDELNKHKNECIDKHDNCINK